MDDRMNGFQSTITAEGTPFQTVIFETDQLCPICGEKLLRGRSIFGEHAIMCKCEEEKLRREKAERLAKGQRLAREQMQKNAGLGKRWVGKTFANFSPRSGQLEAYNVISGWAAAYDPKKTTRGLLLCGTVGSGKTHLAAAVANAVISGLRIEEREAEEAGKLGRYEKDAIPLIFVSTVDLLSRLRSNFDKKSTDRDGDLMERVKSVPLLILDDFGAEKGSEWVSEKLFEIINHRYSEELPTIITTNATPEELKKQVGDRTFDRIKEMCVMIGVTGASNRRAATVEQIWMV